MSSTLLLLLALLLKIWEKKTFVKLLYLTTINREKYTNWIEISLFKEKQIQINFNKKHAIIIDTLVFKTCFANKTVLSFLLQHFGFFSNPILLNNNIDCEGHSVCACVCNYKTQLPWVCVLRCLRVPGRRLLLPPVPMSEGKGAFLDLPRERGDEVWLSLFLLLLSLSNPRDFAFLFILATVGGGLLESESEENEEMRGKEREKHWEIKHTHTYSNNERFQPFGRMMLLCRS